jgi:hypothetical protein
VLVMDDTQKLAGLLDDLATRGVDGAAAPPIDEVSAARNGAAATAAAR